jgi:antitoxin component HigA of HigAB toxin-antitoxin module
MQTLRAPIRLSDLDKARRDELLRAAAAPNEITVLRRLARDLGFPLQAIADEIGVDFWRVQRSLAGRRRAERELLDKIAEVLGVTLLDVRVAMQRRIEAAS